MEHALQIRVFHFVKQGFQLDILVEIHRPDFFADVKCFQASRVGPFNRSPETGFAVESNRVNIPFLGNVDFPFRQLVCHRASSRIVFHAGISLEGIFVTVQGIGIFAGYDPVNLRGGDPKTNAGSTPACILGQITQHEAVFVKTD